MHEDEMVGLIKYLPKEVPIIELGGGKGGLSAILDERLKPKSHLVVEANPDLSSTPMIISYSGKKLAPFYVDRSTNASSEKRGGSPSIVKTVEVPAVRLRDIMVDGAIVICDIEGTEIDIIKYDIGTLKKASYFCVEFHPRITGQFAIRLAKLKLWVYGFKLIDKNGLVYFYKNILKRF